MPNCRQLLHAAACTLHTWSWTCPEPQLLETCSLQHIYCTDGFEKLWHKKHRKKQQKLYFPVVWHCLANLPVAALISRSSISIQKLIATRLHTGKLHQHGVECSGCNPCTAQPASSGHDISLSHVELSASLQLPASATPALLESACMSQGRTSARSQSLSHALQDSSDDITEIYTFFLWHFSTEAEVRPASKLKFSSAHNGASSSSRDVRTFRRGHCISQARICHTIL